MNIDGLFETVVTFPDPAFQRRYEALVGLDTTKERLEKEAEALLRPDLLEKWSSEKHRTRLPALDLLLGRPPLFIFAGDIGTGKTELASTFGDRLARATKLPVELFCLSLRARGSGAVGEMTRLISDAFRYLRSHAAKKNSSGRKTGSTILLIIESAETLLQLAAEVRSNVKLDVRFYEAWPFGVCVQVADSAIYYGLINATLSAMTGPMFLLDDPASPTWKRIAHDLDVIWDNAVPASRLIKGTKRNPVKGRPTR